MTYALLLIVTDTASAGNPINPGRGTFDIVSTRGTLTAMGGDYARHVVDTCPVVTASDASGHGLGGCLASDADLAGWPSSWEYGWCSTVLIDRPVDPVWNPTGQDGIDLVLEYFGPVDALGRSVLPVFPDDVDCETQVGLILTHVHTHRQELGDAPNHEIRQGGWIDAVTTWTTLATTGITVDARTWTDGAKVIHFNVENDNNYTGPSATGMVDARVSTAANAAVYPGVWCGIKNRPNDYGTLVVSEDAPPGLAWCKYAKGNAAKWSLTVVL